MTVQVVKTPSLYVEANNVRGEVLLVEKGQQIALIPALTVVAQLVLVAGDLGDHVTHLAIRLGGVGAVILTRIKSSPAAPQHQHLDQQEMATQEHLGQQTHRAPLVR